MVLHTLLQRMQSVDRISEALQHNNIPFYALNQYP